MSYLSIITLEQARNYLRIDEDFTDDDASIINMINASLSFIEKRTNHIMFPRDKEYIGDKCVNVYDYPINLPLPDGHTACKYSTYSNVTTKDRAVVLNVGYLIPGDVPTELIEVALQMLSVFYYEAEKQANTALIPENVMTLLDCNRRFLL